MSRDFDGIDDKVAFTPTTAITTAAQGTFVCWMKLDDLLGTDISTALLGYGGDNVTNPGILQFSVRRRSAAYTGNRLDITQATEGVATTSGWYCSTTLSSGVWYPVAFQSSGSAWTVYLNFASETLASWVDDGGVGNNGDWFNDTSLTNAVLNIGRGKYDGAEATSFNGKIAYAQNFNTVLSLAEIKQASYYPGSVWRGLTWAPFLWGGSPEADYSGNGNSGTVTGATVSTDNPPINGVFQIPKPDLITVF